MGKKFGTKLTTKGTVYKLGQQALLNWFELVYGPFGQSNMHHRYGNTGSKEGIQNQLNRFLAENQHTYLIKGN